MKSDRLIPRVVLFAFFALVSWLGLRAWALWRPYESDAIADSSWTAGGQPHRITFQVVDVAGSPLAGVDVDMEDTSGGGSGITDANGEWVYHPDGGLLTFRLNGISVMEERDMFFALGPGKEGWKLRVVVKDLAAIGVESR